LYLQEVNANDDSAQSFLTGTTGAIAMKTRRFSSSLNAVLTVTFMALLPAVACGQVYPVKPIRIVVPFQPGGSMEAIARLVGQKLTAAFGQAVIIENRPGAGGIVGTEYVAKSPADGYPSPDLTNSRSPAPNGE